MCVFCFALFDYICISFLIWFRLCCCWNWCWCCCGSAVGIPDLVLLLLSTFKCLCFSLTLSVSVVRATCPTDCLFAVWVCMYVAACWCSIQQRRHARSCRLKKHGHSFAFDCVLFVFVFVCTFQVSNLCFELCTHRMPFFVCERRWDFTPTTGCATPWLSSH